MWAAGDGPVLTTAPALDGPSGRLVAGADADGCGCLLAWDADAGEGSLPSIADVVAVDGTVVAVVAVAGGGPAHIVWEDGTAMLAAHALAGRAAAKPKAAKKSAGRRTILAAAGAHGIAAVVTVPTCKSGGGSVCVSAYSPDGTCLLQDKVVCGGGGGGGGGEGCVPVSAAVCAPAGAAHASLALAWADGSLTLVPLCGGGGGGAGTAGAGTTRRLPGFVAGSTSGPAPAAAATAPAAGRKRTAAATSAEPSTSSPTSSIALADDGAGGVLAAYPTGGGGGGGFAVVAVDGSLAGRQGNDWCVGLLRRARPPAAAAA